MASLIRDFYRVMRDFHIIKVKRISQEKEKRGVIMRSRRKVFIVCLMIAFKPAKVGMMQP